MSSSPERRRDRRAISADRRDNGEEGAGRDQAGDQQRFRRADLDRQGDASAGSEGARRQGGAGPAKAETEEATEEYQTLDLEPDQQEQERPRGAERAQHG